MKRNSFLVKIPLILMIIFISTTLINFNGVIKHNTDYFGDTKPKSSVKNTGFISDASSTLNTILLPGTNLSVTEYFDYSDSIEEGENYNVSILSVGKLKWDIRCDYSITEKIDSPFYSYVNRTGFNHTYVASNYYSWDGTVSPFFDFWIDTIGFYSGYTYTMIIPGQGTVNLTVTNEPDFSTSVGVYQAWKVTYSFGIDVTSWYAQDSGLFLCSTMTIVNPIWYNLTVAEMASLPEDYIGPSLIEVSPSNGSLRPNGSVITITLESPFEIDIIFYNWDNSTNRTSLLTDLTTVFPNSEGIHILLVTAIDSIGVERCHSLIYITDNRLPGISLSNVRNNSHIKGSSFIQPAILSGNGSFIYNWDGIGNSTILEGSSISVPNPSSERNITLNIFAMNNDTKAWAKTKFTFQIDNTPPMISTYDLINGSVLKGTVNFKVKVSEKGYIRYWLNNESNNNFTVEVNRNYSISLENLDNGSYSLEIFATDEANNTGKILLNFSIYTSAFNWDWQIVANTLRKINVVNETGDLLFIVSLLSGSNQKFNLTLVPEGSPPALSDDMEYAVELMCEKPADILFITFSVMLGGSREDFPIFLWFYWDNEDNSWQDMETSYSEVTHSWEATYDGYIQYFGLINTHETTVKKSVIVG
ncbi:MAG: hypothetical protein ACW97X_13870, partial [Candidatus Hodarchaeales archaeon]